MTNICVSLIVAIALACPSLFAKNATELATLNIPRFRIVSDGIYAGGNPTSKADGDQGKAALVLLRIHGVISLQGGDIDGTWKGKFSEWRQKGERPEAIAEEKAYFESRGLRWSNYPLNSHAPITPEEDRDIMAALKEMAAATANDPVFLHCEHGADRTGLLIALFRVYHQGWAPDLAYEEWLANGHSWLARVFTHFLDDYFFEKTGWSPTLAPTALMEKAQIADPTCAHMIAEK
jgi:hypothetical protein